jgi:hypothetical protein
MVKFLINFTTEGGNFEVDLFCPFITGPVCKQLCWMIYFLVSAYMYSFEIEVFPLQAMQGSPLLMQIKTLNPCNLKCNIFITKVYFPYHSHTMT